MKLANDDLHINAKSSYPRISVTREDSVLGQSVISTSTTTLFIVRIQLLHFLSRTRSTDLIFLCGFFLCVFRTCG
jgi:hypothetical protein